MYGLIWELIVRKNVILGDKMRKHLIWILFSMFFKPVYFIGLNIAYIEMNLL